MTILEIILTVIVVIIVLMGIRVYSRWIKTLNDFYKNL